MNRDNHTLNQNQTDSQIRQKRRERAERAWKEAPIKEYHKSQDLTDLHVMREKNVLSRFNEFLNQSEAVPNDVEGVRDVVESDIEFFIDQDLDPDPNLGDRTHIDYLDILSKFYNVLVDKNAIGTNPVQKPLSEERKTRDWSSPDRPFITFNHMQQYLKWLDTPFARAFILTGLKTSSRAGEALNIDFRCCHIDHPVFWSLVDKHDVTLDPRIRDKPDSLLIYEEFNAGEEIPNTKTPGPEEQGEVRGSGNKRKENNGSIIPIDSELKTAIIEYLLIRPDTTGRLIQPLFTNRKKEEGGSTPPRLGSDAMMVRLFRSDKTPDSVLKYGRERAIDQCPECDGPVVEWNQINVNRTGRVFECQECGAEHRRPITWDHNLSTEQKFTFHCARHYFSDAHREGSSKLHNGELVDRIRQYRIRGDRDTGDADTEAYQDKQNQDWERDVREPYLAAIYKFGIYDTIIPAHGEGYSTAN